MEWGVYKAHDRVLVETVAIKVLRSDIARDPDLARRFRSEIKLARKVSHRNVCRIHEYGEEGGLGYISMEYIDGVDLRQMLQERGPLPPEEGFEVALQVAKGLAAIHDVGIIHRDLKTPNIMRDRRGVIRLMDFGIAKEWSTDGTPATATGHIVGTPEYMSPEQVRAERLDFRSDFYALGVVFFEMFTGRVPFKGDSAASTMLMHLYEPPRFDGKDAGRIPVALVPVLRQMLAKGPGERQASAREVVEVVRQARAQTFPSARATPGAMPILTATAPDLDVRPATPTPTPMPDATATFPGAKPAVSAAESQAATVPAAKARPRWLLTAPVLAVAVVVAYVAGRGGGSSPSPLPAPASPQAALPKEAPSAAPAAAPSVIPVEPATTPAPKPPAADAARATPSPAHRAAAPSASTQIELAPRPAPQAPPSPKPLEPVAAPAVDANSPGTLALSSTPSAAIVLDGQPRGRTPATISDLPPGRHTLVLTADDGRVFQEDVAVAAGARVERSHRFVGFGSLSVTSDVWVSVSVDGAPSRPTPVRVDRLVAGRHVVRASRPGYKEKLLEVDIQEGETRRVSVSLEPE